MAARRIAIKKRMAAKGYDRVAAGQPDLFLHYHASVNQKVDVYEADRSHGYAPSTTESRVERNSSPTCCH